MSKKLITTAALVAAIVLPLSAFAQGGGGGGGGAGGAGGGSAGAAGGAGGGTAGMSGSAGTGSTSSGIGSSPGASSVGTTGQTNRANTTGQVNEAVSPANPSTTAPGGPNSQLVPNQTVQAQLAVTGALPARHCALVLGPRAGPIKQGPGSLRGQRPCEVHPPARPLDR